MAQQPPTSFLGQLVRDLDDNHSRIYVTIAFLFYLVPVALISILFISAADNSRFDIAFIALFWVAIVVLPLMLTFGVFIVYRATYTARTYFETDNDHPHHIPNSEEKQWDIVINKALDWHRFLMPLCLLNMFITLVGGFLLFGDLSSTRILEGAPRNAIIFGFNDYTLYFGNSFSVIPGSIFYLGLLGFMVQFLEMTRRRYVSRNLVPRFYLMSAFRLLQVLIVVMVIFLFMSTAVSEPSLMLVTAFVVGMFPLQLLTPVIEGSRRRLGMATSTKLPITLINGIDNTLESLLQEENIDSVQILATTDVAEIQKRTAIPQQALSNWQRQARLFDVLGTEELIHRFSRNGINDFDDLRVLVNAMQGAPIDPYAFRQDFTSAMRVKSDEEVIGTDAFWRVLVQVVVREYIAEFPEAASLISAPVVMSPPAVPETAMGEAPMSDLSISEPAMGETAMGETAMGETAMTGFLINEASMSEAAIGETGMSERSIIEAPMSELSITEPTMMGEAPMNELSITEPTMMGEAPMSELSITEPTMMDETAMTDFSISEPSMDEFTENG